MLEINRAINMNISASALSTVSSPTSNFNQMYSMFLHFYILRSLRFDSEPNLFIDLLIFYLFRIFLNEVNKCSHASGDMGSTMIKIFRGFCFNARVLHTTIQNDASRAVSCSIAACVYKALFPLDIWLCKCCSIGVTDRQTDRQTHPIRHFRSKILYCTITITAESLFVNFHE